MKVIGRKPLVATIIILSAINTIFFMPYLFNATTNVSRILDFWSVFDLSFTLIEVISPLIAVVGILINKRKMTFISMGVFYLLNTIILLNAFFNILFSHFYYAQTTTLIINGFILFFSFIGTICFFLLAFNKENSIIMLLGCTIMPYFMSIYYLTTNMWYNNLLSLLFLTIYLFTICIVCYYVYPKEKCNTNIYSSEVNFYYKNIAVSIIFSITTFGIYTILWLSDTVGNIHRLQPISKSVIGEVLLILFVPFYSWYWFYTRGKQMFEDSRKNGGNIPDNSILYLVLSIFGLNLINLAVMQNCFNKYTVGITVPQVQPQINSHISSRLKELQVLASQGLITPEEYESKRKNILDKL